MSGAFETERRRALSPSEKARVRSEQHDLCAECGEPLAGKIEFDHITPLCMGGTNDLKNFAALHAKPCHQGRTAKTAAMRSKADRMGGGRGSQWKRRQEGKTQGFRQWLSMSGEKRTRKPDSPQ